MVKSLKILSILLTLLIFARSVSLYVFFTTGNFFISEEQNSAKFISASSDYNFVLNDRTKVIDNTQQQQNSRHCSFDSDYIKHQIDKVSTLVEAVKSVTFVMGTENKPIFRNHFLTFPFHNFY